MRNLMQWLTSRDTKQRGAALALAVGAYMTAMCPCDRIMSCHKHHFFWLVAGPFAVVVYDWYC